MNMICQNSENLNPMDNCTLLTVSRNTPSLTLTATSDEVATAGSVSVMTTSNRRRGESGIELNEALAVARRFGPPLKPRRRISQPDFEKGYEPEENHEKEFVDETVRICEEINPPVNFITFMTNSIPLPNGTEDGIPQSMRQPKLSRTGRDGPNEQSDTDLKMALKQKRPPERPVRQRTITSIDGNDEDQETITNNADAIDDHCLQQHCAAGQRVGQIQGGRTFQRHPQRCRLNNTEQIMINSSWLCKIDYPPQCPVRTLY
jgi:hypothetical protein